jgi:hypothetical protein
MTVRVLAVVQTLPMGAAWLTRDVKAQAGDVDLGNLKSIGRCLSFLVSIGQIEIVKRVVMPGERTRRR